MFDILLTKEILNQIYQATQKVLERFSAIKNVSNFTNSATGMEKLDAICMQLIAIGESLKNLDKVTKQKLLSQYPEIDWRGAKGMRDIITHHYFDVDAEAIFNVCNEKIEPMAHTLLKMLADLNNV